MNNVSGKYGIWLNELNAWAQTSSGLIYKYDDKRLAEDHIQKFWYAHRARVIFFEKRR